MMLAMMKAVAKAIKVMPWWQKALMGAAACVAFDTAVRVMDYFLQEIDDAANKKSDSSWPEDRIEKG